MFCEVITHNVTVYSEAFSRIVKNIEIKKGNESS